MVINSTSMPYLDAPPTEVIPQPVVRHNLVRKEDRIAFQELQFICSFPPEDTNFYYQVVWYIEDKPVVVTEPVKKDSITKTNLGRSDGDPTKGYLKLGINVTYFCYAAIKTIYEYITSFKILTLCFTFLQNTYNYRINDFIVLDCPCNY